MSTRQLFAEAVLQDLGVPQSGASVDALVAVMVGEGTAAGWNPCATEEKAPGSVDFNEAGVQTYPSFAAGVAATVKTLKDGDYGMVRVELGQAVDAKAIVTAWALSPWGTFGHDVTKAVDTLLTVDANRSHEYAVEVTGPEPVEEPTHPSPAPAPTQPTEPTPGPVEPPAEPPASPAPAPPEEVIVSVAVPQLQTGSTGRSVETVQICLNEKFAASPPLVVDGDLGPKTDELVRAFQTVHHLTVDGIVGPQTWGVLITG
jgi:hypothetical protein